MNPLAVHRELTDAYRRFVGSSQQFQDDDVERWVEERIDRDQFLWREPLVTVRRRFKYGDDLETLVEDGYLDRRVLPCFTVAIGDRDAEPIRPFEHQTDAIKLLTDETPSNVVVATGTGSGKSFTFSIPIVSEALRARVAGHRGVKAILIYPMNALANSQYEEIAKRLHGSGLTVANYTGDMARTYETALRDFHDLTGRSEPFDSEVICRDHVRDRGVDILITNYVMLELILTRFDDRSIFPFEQLGELQFLVLDEVHTYTGRQGADVACLLRRVKEHTGTAGRLRCIGTSATVDSDVGEAQGREAIAEFATELFGEPFRADAVITERYAEPVTGEANYLAPAPDVSSDLLDRLDRGEPEALTEAARALTGRQSPTSNELREQATISFLERFCSEGIRSWRDIQSAYEAEHRHEGDAEAVKRELEAALVVGNATLVDVDGDPVPLLIPKVHSFISQGRPITRCLSGHYSDRGEISCAQCEPEQPTFGVVFCNSCGATALSAARNESGEQVRYVPSDFAGDDVRGEPGYLFTSPWDRASVPPDERRVKKDGTARKGWEGAVPENLALLPDGSYADGDGIEVAWVVTPLFLCPSCGVQYTRRSGEYHKFFQAGFVGRATASDVLIGEILQRVPQIPERQKRSLIAFADNRQDTAFQAAHINDFQRRVHFRRAMWHTLNDMGAVDDATTARPITELGPRILETMERAGTLPRFSGPDIEVGQARHAARTRYARYLGFNVVGDLVGRTRWQNNRTLHDVGLLDIEYSGLADIAADDAIWSGLPSMAAANADDRHDALRAILDIMRIGLAVDTQSLTKGDDFRENVIDRLDQEALFHEPRLPPFRPTVFSDDLAAGVADRQITLRRFTFHEDNPRSPALVRYLMVLRPAIHDRDDAKALVHGIIEILSDRGLLHVSERQGGHIYRLNEDALLVVANTAHEGQRCPKCNTRWQFRQERPCPQCGLENLTTVTHSWQHDYVRNEYLARVGDRTPVLAGEHSAQVPGADRKRAEKRFKDVSDPLNTLICTPTMELGIDIGGLSAVFMRNVPPSPANYAQRQGRSGRHGQPAYVATFCGTLGKFGSHDQYFYRFPDRMVAGRVAPPRFLLENEDLLTAHLNALVLEYLDFRVRSRPEEFIDFGDRVHFIPDQVAELQGKVHAQLGGITEHAWSALGGEFAAVGRERTWVAEHISSFPQRYREAWQPLIEEYETIRVEAREIARAQEHGDTSPESEIRRRSILGRMNDMRQGHGDFVPYTFLGSQGFLPNYAFPRRASSAYFTDLKESVGRHRVVALREFAPEASIYYRGQRYRVERAQPRARGGQINWTTIKLCNCGAYVSNEQVGTAAVCRTCGQDQSESFANSRSLELPDAVARPQNRISSDEDDRRRRGYDIRVSYALPSTRIEGELAAGDDPVGRVTYAHNARLLSTNLGTRVRHGEPDGFKLCTKCRRWILSDTEEERHVDDENPRGSCPAGGDREDVVPGVWLLAEGRHDAVALDLAIPPDADPRRFGTSVLHALLDGFEIAFSADESEVSGVVYPDSDEQRVRILLYEKEEGGVGLLHHFVEGEAWQRVARRSLELLHVDLASGHDRPDACTTACYDCLLSFYNQFDHELLDRNLAVGWLLQIADGPIHLDLTGPEDRWDSLVAAAASSAEAQVLSELRSRGFPPPEGQHVVIPDGDGVAIAEADLTYPGKVVVRVHGDPHNWEHVQRADAAQRRKLLALGYKVVEIDMDDQGPGLDQLASRLGIEQSLSATASFAEAEAQPEQPPSVEPEPLPPLPLVAREEIGDSTEWVPVYDISRGRSPAQDEVLGWLHVPGVQLSEDAFGVQHPGRSLEDEYPRGSVILFEPVEDPSDVEEALTVLVDLGGQTDPDTLTRFGIRAWWPEYDESEGLTGLMLSARHTNSVEPLEVNDPGTVTLLGRFAGGVPVEPR